MGARGGERGLPMGQLIQALPRDLRLCHIARLQPAEQVGVTLPDIFFGQPVGNGQTEGAQVSRFGLGDRLRLDLAVRRSGHGLKSAGEVINQGIGSAGRLFVVCVPMAIPLWLWGGDRTRDGLLNRQVLCQRSCPTVGRRGTRIPDHQVANRALSQLRYVPT